MEHIRTYNGLEDLIEKGGKFTWAMGFNGVHFLDYQLHFLKRDAFADVLYMPRRESSLTLI